MFKIRMCCACPFCIKVIVYEPSIRDHSSRTMDVYVYVDKLGQCTVTGYWVSIDFWCSYTNQDSFITTAWSLTNQDIYVMTRRGGGDYPMHFYCQARSPNPHRPWYIYLPGVDSDSLTKNVPSGWSSSSNSASSLSIEPQSHDGPLVRRRTKRI